MFKSQEYNYAVFGNPINHSKSPEIHSFFSVQTGISYLYKSIHVPLDNFSSTIFNFFKNNGLGANITAPFKKEAYFFANTLTKRAKIAQSVNTFKKINSKNILGDNTDGIGLLSDLIRLNFIKKNYTVLVVGAGGAVQGILFPLLSFGCSVFLLNRTFENAEKLACQFNKYGNIHVFKKHIFKNKHFDLIINARSKDVNQNENFIPCSVMSSKTFFYDINYDIGNTPFIDWCIKKGAIFFSNGIGMLVFQAAHSFYLWYNVFPETNYIIDSLKQHDSQ